MYQTLFYIPNQIGPIPFLTWNEDWGFGLVWLVLVLSGGIVLFSKIRREGWTRDALYSLLTLLGVAAAYAVLAPKIVEPQGLPVQGYGVMLLIAVVLGIALAVYRSRQMGVDPEIIYSITFWVFIGGIIGARLFYVVEYHEQFLRYDSQGELLLKDTLLAMANLTRGGLVVYGSFLGAALAFGIFTWRYRLPVRPLCDYFVASLVLGQGIGRIGCLLNGCCFGGVCEQPNLPQVTFPFGSPPHYRQVETGALYLHGLKLAGDPSGAVFIDEVEPGSPAAETGLEAGDVVVSINDVLIASVGHARQVLFSISQPGEEIAIRVRGDVQPHSWSLDQPPPRSLPVHPTQIYSAINGLLFFFFAWVYFPFRRRDGEVFAILLTLFPVTRFMMEIVRVDEPQAFWLGMTISQVISVYLIAASGLFWFWVLRQPKGTLMQPADWQPHNERWARGK